MGVETGFDPAVSVLAAIAPGTEAANADAAKMRIRANVFIVLGFTKSEKWIYMPQDADPKNFELPEVTEECSSVRG
jgi:hypothetical protein